MRVGIVTASTYVAMLVLLFYFVGHECKKKKSSFTFEALMAGMNSKEKEMFKEELNKEVKKFRASQQKHHKQKAIVRKPPKKHKLKDKLPKFLPGICDPICAHQCVHGCDFRCCIPDYQQLHKIPRPPPMVVLPGSCSPTCSPTCRPLCTEKCCEGGPGGMFQSSKDLITLDTQSCPEGCSKDCMPRCVISCCVQHMPSYVAAPKPGAPQTKETSTPGQLTVQQEAPHVAEASAVQNQSPNHNENSAAPPVPEMRHSVETSTRPDLATIQRMRMAMQDAQQVRNVQQMNQSPVGPQLEGHIPRAYFLRDIKCGAGCPDFCAPLCQQGCCASAKRDYTKIPMLFKTPQLMSQGVPFQFKGPLQLKYSALANHPKALMPLSRQNCPVECFSSCKPQCEVRCCTLQRMSPFASQSSLNGREVHSRSAFLRPVTLSQMMHQSNLAHMLPAEDVQQPRMGVARKRIQTIEQSNGGGNYESNIETIHALSKDMISKPEPANEHERAQREHVEVDTQGKNYMLRGVIPTQAGHKGVENKRSSLPSAPSVANIDTKEKPQRLVATQTKDRIPQDSSKNLVGKTENVAQQQKKPKSEVPKSAAPQSNPLPSSSNTQVDKKNEVKKSPGESVTTKSGTIANKKDGIKPIIKDDLKPVKKDDIKQTKDSRSQIREEDTIPAKKDVINESTHILSKKATIPVKVAHDVKSPDVKKSDIPQLSNNAKDINGDKKSTASVSSECPHQCPNSCAPNCDKPCCNRQIVYEAFHKTQKKSKVKYQLQMLK